MAALMARHAGNFAIRKLLNRTVSTQRHVLRSSQINNINVKHRIPSLSAGLHWSSVRRSVEIPEVDEIDIDPTVVPETENAGTPTAPIDLDVLLSDMQYSLEKHERVRPWCVEQVLDTMSSDSKFSVPDSTWALLLRSCGKALMNSPDSERQGLLERTVDLMRQKEVIFSAEHHNAVLQSRLENNVNLSLSSCVEEMVAQSIPLDGTTYHLIIRRFCDIGDIEGALQMMNNFEKSSDSVSELMYTPLISRFMSSRDTEKALGIVARMEKHGASVGMDSYRSLMVGYASLGDMEGITQTLNTAFTKNVSVDPQSVLVVIETLLSNSSTENISELTDVLVRILQDSRYKLETVNAIYRLKSRSETAAFQLFESLESNMTSKDIISLLDRLILSKGNGYDFALQILQLVQSKNRTFRLYETESMLKLLSMLSHEDSVKLWSHLLRVCNLEEVSEWLEVLGSPKEEVINNGDKKFLDFLTLGHFERAVWFARNNSVKITSIPMSLTRAFLKGFVKSGRDLQGVAWALKQCALITGMQLVKVNSDVAFTILEDPRTSHDEVKTLLKYAWQYDVKFLDEYVRMAVKKARSLEHKEFLDRWAMDLMVHIPTRAEMLTMNLVQLEELVAKLELMGVESVDVLEISLEKYEALNEEKAEQVKQKLDCLYYRDAHHKLEACAFAAAEFRQDPKEADEYLRVLLQYFPSYSTTEFQLRKAICQVENDLMDEAFKTVKAMENHPTKDTMQRCSDDFFYRFPVDIPVIHDLLLRFENLEVVCDMVHLLWEKGIVDDTQVLSYVIRQNLKRWRFHVLDSMFGADVHDPLSDKLFQTKHDPGTSAKNSTVNGGLLEAQFLLYCTLVEEGHTEWIKECFENPNFRPSHRVLVELCLWIFANYEDTELDELLGLVLDIKSLEIDQLVSDLSRTIPAEQLASSIFSKFSSVRDSNSNQAKTNKKLRNRNETLISYLETSQKPLDLVTIKDHVVKLARNNMWIEFVDFVCALRNKQLSKELMFVAAAATKPNWATYTLKQAMRMEVENENYAGVETFIKKIKSNRSWSKLPFIHIPSLTTLRERKPELACDLEEHMIAQCRHNHLSGVQLIMFYLKTDRMADVRHLLEKNAAFRENLRPSVIINSLEGDAMWCDEKELAKILRLPVAKKHQVDLRVPVYDQLINIVCDHRNWQAGCYYYNEAVDDGVQLGQLKASTLKKLQTLLEENRRPVPWATSLSQILVAKNR